MFHYKVAQRCLYFNDFQQVYGFLISGISFFAMHPRHSKDTVLLNVTLTHVNKCLIFFMNPRNFSSHSFVKDIHGIDEKLNLHGMKFKEYPREG